MATKRPTAKKAAKAKKQTKSPSSDVLTRVRTVCLAFPEAHEVEAWGEPTFRVKNKLFAMFAAPNNHHGGGRPAVWINADHTTQDMLMRAKPKQYFKPPYVGVGGWVGAWLDGRPSWTEIEELLREGYRQRAPKKLAALLDAD
jgi:hypothetical protein